MDSAPNTSIDHRRSLPSKPLPRKTEPEDHGSAKVGGGFPHSEIQGSKPVRGSPRLIAAYHVLHRLSAPRHPPDTLMTLDHSHHRCPPQGSGDPCPAGEGPSTLGTPFDGVPGSVQRRTPRPLLPNVSEAGGGQGSPSPRPSRPARFTADRRQGDVGPSDRAAPACCACFAARPSGRTHSLFTMSINTLGQKAGRCASRRGRWRILWNADGLGSLGGSAWSARPPRPCSGRCRMPGSPRASRWSKTGSNRRPHACKARALPTELLPHEEGRLDAGRAAP